MPSVVSAARMPGASPARTSITKAMLTIRYETDLWVAAKRKRDPGYPF